MEYEHVLFFLSLPPSTMSISVYNPFSLKKDLEFSALRLQLQEIIYYAESRFRAILKDQESADMDWKGWIQKLLHRELVGALVFLQCNY